MILSRSDNSMLGRWWWTVDRLMLSLVLILMVTGLWLTFTASPAVAERNNEAQLHYFYRQLIFLGPSVAALLFMSFLSEKWVRRLSVLGLGGGLVLLLLTLFIGTSVKGATRWLDLGPITVQPSEFVKPFFIVTSAWLLSACFTRPDVPARWVSAGLWAVVVLLLVRQPDFGQTLLLSTIWTAQLMLAGLPFLGIVVAGVAGLVGMGIAYATVPYFASRIDRFIDPSSGDNYQVGLAREAFESGGLVGRGPNEGVVKLSLPDAHSDYIFSVVGEEFGALAGALLIMVFAAIVLRGLMQLHKEEDPFRFLAASGLLMQFGLQALINIGVSTDILPSKGMTLPFVSYGGSSMLALSIGMGMVLALTRRSRVPAASHGTSIGLISSDPKRWSGMP